MNKSVAMQHVVQHSMPQRIGMPLSRNVDAAASARACIRGRCHRTSGWCWTWEEAPRAGCGRLRENPPQKGRRRQTIARALWGGDRDLLAGLKVRRRTVRAGALPSAGSGSGASRDGAARNAEKPLDQRFGE